MGFVVIFTGEDELLATIDVPELGDMPDDPLEDWPAEARMVIAKVVVEWLKDGDADLPDQVEQG